MKLIVKIGNVYRSVGWGGGTYFETDEEYETSCVNIEDAELELKQQFYIYSIDQKRDDLIVACVY